jgi:hypothetical protein
MPSPWTDQDERQYQHIVASERARGRSEHDARELAARTVNEQRARARTGRSETSSSANLRLDERSYAELYDWAAELDVANRSRMTRHELIDAICARQ